MNISIKTNETQPVLSPLKSGKTSQIYQDKQGVLNPDALTSQQSRQIGSVSEKSNKTEQNSQLKNSTKLGDEQKGEDTQQNAIKDKDAQTIVDELNEYMNELQTTLGFSVKTEPQHQLIFEIKDRKTNEVIKQIPSEEIQKIRERMHELTGLLLDQKA